MSVKELGYLDFFGQRCVFVQDDMTYILLPTDEKANILPYFRKSNFLLSYSTTHYKKCTISVKKVHLRIDLRSVQLELRYICKRISEDFVDGFIISGNEIDEFFSPLEYYFRNRLKGEYNSKDLLYDKEVAAEYNFLYKGSKVVVQLVYGDVLVSGIRSDLTIHPKLIVTFGSTDDMDFVFDVYMVIVRFMMFVHRKRFYNFANLELFCKKDTTISMCGRMFEKLYNVDYRPSARIDASFVYYGDKISNLLSIIANESDFPLNHLGFYLTDAFKYPAERISAISAAFEYEYDLCKDCPQTSEWDYSSLKTKILGFIDNIAESTMHEEQKKFLDNAKNRINQLGTKIGLKREIQNAYKANEDVLRSSLNYILSINKEVNRIANGFSDLRGKVIHHESGHQFDEREIEIIRFVEILQFVMVLKRAQYTSEEIEIILGVRYNCNDKYLSMLCRKEDGTDK